MPFGIRGYYEIMLYKWNNHKLVDIQWSLYSHVNVQINITVVIIINVNNIVYYLACLTIM